MHQVINTQNKGYIVLNQTYNKDIQINTYDEKTFEGTCNFLTREQAKELVEKLMPLIYDNDEES